MLCLLLRSFPSMSRRRNKCPSWTSNQLLGTGVWPSFDDWNFPLTDKSSKNVWRTFCCQRTKFSKNKKKEKWLAQRKVKTFLFCHSAMCLKHCIHMEYLILLFEFSTTVLLFHSYFVWSTLHSQVALFILLDKNNCN